ncbi:MAG: ABC transporter permease [Chloroflexota bacterium]|nr:ABC transporter permease [Chloroflexota bacterium]
MVGTLKRTNRTEATIVAPIPPRKAIRRRDATWLNALAPVAAFVLLIVVWKLAVVIGGYEAFILPPPEAVARSFWDALRDGLLWPHVRTTLIEAGYGALLGIAVAFVLGYIVVHLPLVDRAVAPVVAASQALPAVALAPIIILWFGTGLLPKVLICALIVFFPVLVTWTVGLRGIDRAFRDVARIYGATAWQTLRYVEIPLALRSLLGGVRIAFTLAVTGAVIGEFVSANRGLGYLLKQAEFLYDTPLKFVALFCLMAIAALGYAVIALLERLLLSWED